MANIRTLFSPRAPWPWLAALYLLIAVAAQFLPLTREIHYELALFSALCASLFTGMAFIAGPTIRLRRPVDVSLSHAADTLSLAERTAIATLLSLTPLAGAIVLGLGRPQCGLLDGVAWYLLLVPPAAWISAVLALACQIVARRRWLQMILFILLWLGSMARGAYEALTGPHIFLYAWQVGFFPGGSWDAELPITPTLLAYRAAHLLAAGALGLLLVELRRTSLDPNRGTRRPGVIAFALLCGILGVVAVAYRPELGLTRTDSWLQRELGDSLHTRHTTIWYDAAGVDSLDIWRAANRADFYVERQARAFGFAGDRIEPITFYLHSSSEEQKRLVGTSSASFTKPWRRTLNMPAGRIDDALEHELAHIVIEPFGNVLGISWSQGLLEGAAMAMENDVGWRTLHQYARALHDFDMAPPAERLMGTSGFTAYSSSLSYALAGSFSKWLIDRRGMKRYLVAYPGGDFERAYGRGLDELSAEYRAFIDSLPPVDPRFRPAIRYQFGGGSFFAQKCLRRIGTLNATGFDALAARRYGVALDRFGESLREGINYGARAGVIGALKGMGRYRALLDSAAVYMRDTAAYPLLPYLLEIGDAHWALGDTADARRLYDSVLTLDIGRGISMRAALRLWFLDANDTLRSIMRTYFTHSMEQAQILVVLDQAFPHARRPYEQLILAMMRGSFTVNTLPLTTLGHLSDRLPTEPFPIDHRVALPRLEGAIIPALAANFVDAALMAETLSRSQPSADMSALSVWSRGLVSWAFTPPAGSSIDDPNSPAGWLAERLEETSEFREYLRERAIEPWR